ncbi:MFS transporter [uncultured Cohaesibacter sp.]|uniref:MFS transporter n=1 Tax=uncultured Cohaesibacter sp. TaxID=1002546 RepID=UPI0029302E5B|nr:MFS transporter [uncultured Cohaesibacter sp.]
MSTTVESQAGTGKTATKSLVPTYMTSQSYAVVAVCFLSWMFATIGNGVYSVASPMLKEMFSMDNATAGMVVSIFSLGGWVSTLFIPKIADKHGRRIGLAICILIVVLCNGSYALIGSLGMLFVVRFFANWGNTCIWAINASYISEIVPAPKRGFATGIMQSGTPIGNFTSSFLIGLLVAAGYAWQTASYVFPIAIILLVPIFFVLKETPTWLRNRSELQRAKQEAAQNAEAAAAVGKTQSYGELFKPQYRKNVLIGIAMAMVSAILAWGNSAYFVLSLADMGFDAATRVTMHMTLWGVAIIGYATSGIISDKIGRKHAMLLFRTPMVIALGVMYYMYVSQNINVPVVYAMLAIAGLGMGGVTIQITYTNEMMPSHVRTMGTGFAIGIGRITAMIGVPMLGVLADWTSLPFAWWMASIIGWLMVPLIYFGAETAGKDIDALSEQASS